MFMSRPALRQAGIVVLRLLLGGIFLMAGWSKLGMTMQTLAAIYSYQIVLPDGLAQAVAVALPWVEILLGALIVIGLWPRVTPIAAALVLGAFTVLTAQAWWRGLAMDCGCLDWEAIHPTLAVLSTAGGATLRNLVLLGLAGLLTWLQRQPQRAE